MAKYFSKFPKVFYQFNGTENATLLTNILTRVRMSDSILNNTLLYYTYDIQEGDTPEIIAEKYYGDAEKHWIVLLTNLIFDPFYEWPLNYQNFKNFIDDKYGSQATAQTTIHHYEKIIESLDTRTGTSTTRVYIIDETAYNDMQAEPLFQTKTFSNGYSVNVTTSRKSVDAYDYEVNLNLSRNTIKIMNSQFAPQAEIELTKLMRAQ